ncbi:MAG: ATP-binding protein, partial [Pseudomonadota bacterium]
MIAERRLWDSLETIQDGFAVFDPTGVMIAANRAYLAAFDGLDMVGPGIHYHELIALMTEEGIVDLEDQTAEDWRAMMIKRWDKARIDPVTVKLWNGAFIKVMDNRTRDGDMVSLGLNITSTIKREAALEEARAKAEAANRAKSAFLANMSHEIRTPMNGVIGMADMLSETGLDDEQRLFVETIKNSGEALLVIINDVLDYSKIEAKKLELNPTEFDLERCIHEVLMLLQPSAHDKGLHLAVDYDMFMPTRFIGDPGRMRQILTNLAGNAVKFTQKGHVAIRVVGLPVQDGDAFRIHVTVEDTGIGIPPDKIRTVFGEFNQVEDERNRRYDGTGLGLAISKRLVELMEGEIWVDSEVDVGSGFGFHVTMPVAEKTVDLVLTAPDWIDRVVLVDEPEMTRAILSKQISAMGAKVTAARSSELEGLRLTNRDIVVFGDLGLAESLSAHLARPDAPKAIALLSAPVSGDAPPWISASIQKPAQRRDIARTLEDLPAPILEQTELQVAVGVSPSIQFSHPMPYSFVNAA